MVRKPRLRRTSRKGAFRRRPPRHRAVWLLYQATRLIPVLIVIAGVAATAVVVVGDTAAYAAGADAPIPVAAESIEAVVREIRLWLVGILATVATLFLTVGGLRYLAANGDPGEVERAKSALKSAALGYGLALLAPLFVTIVGGWVD